MLLTLGYFTCHPGSSRLEYSLIANPFCRYYETYCLATAIPELNLQALIICSAKTSAKLGGGGGPAAVTASSPATVDSEGGSTTAKAANTSAATATPSKADVELRFFVRVGGAMAAVFGVAM